ncbi:MAG TPA: dihydrolipoamide acetyltransferase family protein, partial [Vicinamibacterales bacterium]|nr:dihydrolipoamide acetyltransferase family protein [Vicinamibacterales bacterium]
MPALEMAQETGKLVSWKKKEGEQVKKGEILLEVETDKAVVEIEAAADGVLAGVSAKVDDVVPVGQIIAWLLKAGESVPASAGAPQQSGRKMEAAPAAAAAPAAPEPVAPASVAGAKISPKARRLAREHNVDISKVRGSGPGGEILADDIMSAARMPAPAAAASAPAASAPATPAPASTSAPASADTGAVSSIGKIMAERTTQSWTQVPQFYVTRAVDATNLNASRTRRVPEVERSHGVKATHTDILVAAVARSLRHFPRMNGSWNNGSIAMHDEVNVALAMAVENAVVTAVIKNADKLALGDIAKQRKELTERARANRLSPADIGGATFTISNLGMMEVDAFTAIIVPPQAGILAVGAIKDQVVAAGG